jgi:hypothetical protein
MTQPTARQSHIDTALTNLSIGFKNQEYIADQIFPTLRVAKQTDKFFVFTKADWFRDDADVRAPGARAPLVGYTLSSSPYVCVERAAAKRVTDEERDNADAPLDPYRTATEYATDKLLLNKEIDVFTDVFGASVWTNSAVPATLWDVDTSDPLDDIATGIYTVESSIGRAVNIAVIGLGLWRHVGRHPDILDAIKGSAGPTNPARLAMAAFSTLIGVEKILIGRAIKNTASEGLTASYSMIGGLHMFLGFVAPGPSLATPSAGYIFSWRNREVNRYREELEHADLVECRESWDSKVTAPDAGYLFVNAASS